MSGPQNGAVSLVTDGVLSPTATLSCLEIAILVYTDKYIVFLSYRLPETRMDAFYIIELQLILTIQNIYSE